MKEIKAKQTEITEKPKSNLVKMEKDGFKADVHPLEVENYEAAGFVKV